MSWLIYIEPQTDKTNKMTSAPSKDSDQHGHPPSLISLHCQPERNFVSLATHWEQWKTMIDQNGRMPRLIWVFAVRTGHFVSFNMLRLILCIRCLYSSTWCCIPSFKVISLLVPEKNVLRFLPYVGMAATLVMWYGPVEQTFIPPFHGGSIWNLTLIGPVKMFENVDTHTYTWERPTYPISS